MDSAGFVLLDRSRPPTVMVIMFTKKTDLLLDYPLCIICLILNISRSESFLLTGTDMCPQCPLGKFSNRERGLDLMNIESATQTILGASNIQAASITDMCHDPTDQDHIFVVDRSVHVIFRLNVISGSSTHFAGLSGTQEFADGVGTDIRFRQPQAVAASPDGESLFVADTGEALLFLLA